MTSRARANAEAAMERAKAKGEFDLAAKRIMASRPVGRVGGVRDSMWIKNMTFEAERLVKKAASEGVVLSIDEAMDQASQSIPPPGAGSKGRDTLTPAQRVTAIRERLNAGHLTPDDRSNLTRELDELIAESKRKPKSKDEGDGKKQNYEGEISASGKWKFSSGKWVPNV
jgi:hypothetical protein